MQYAVELYYDEETQNKISALAEMIAQKKISTKFLEWKHDRTLLWRVFMMSMKIYVSKN